MLATPSAVRGEAFTRRELQEIDSIMSGGVRRDPNVEQSRQERCEMKCRDLMNVNPEWISSRATVKEAAELMRDRSVGVLLVFDPEPGRLKGIVTDRDLATRACAENKRPDETLVVDIATTDIVTCVDEDDVTVAETKMGESEKARLVVLDGTGEPVGILSLTDILSGDRPGRAVRTARAVLARESKGSQPATDRIKLTPSTVADEDAAARQTSVMVGGSRDGSMKEFPT
jgi:CBS domain-containing protein